MPECLAPEADKQADRRPQWRGIFIDARIHGPGNEDRQLGPAMEGHLYRCPNKNMAAGIAEGTEHPQWRGIFIDARIGNRTAGTSGSTPPRNGGASL